MVKVVTKMMSQCECDRVNVRKSDDQQVGRVKQEVDSQDKVMHGRKNNYLFLKIGRKVDEQW